MQRPGTGELWSERQSLGPAEECQLHAVGARRGGDPRQLGKLGLGGGDDELAAAPLGDAALATEVVQALTARDAQACLERAARIIDAGMDHLAVARAGAGAEALAGFKNQYLAALQRELPRHRKPDDACP